MLTSTDLNTRSGLKKVHVAFWELQPKLEALFDKYRSNEKIACGIITIWSGMCEDSVLQEKLIATGMCIFQSSYAQILSPLLL